MATPPDGKIERILDVGCTIGQMTVALKERFPDIELHLLGPLQTNKAKEAIELFDVIETLDQFSK